MFNRLQYKLRRENSTRTINLEVRRYCRLILVYITPLLLISSVQAQQWKTITEINGSGTKITEPFTISSDKEYRIVWKSEATGIAKEKDGSGHLLKIKLKKPDHPGYSRMVGLTSNTTHYQEESDLNKPGTYQLAIKAANSKWNVKIQMRN